MQVITVLDVFRELGQGGYWDEIRRRDGVLLVTSPALQILAHEALVVVRDEATPPFHLHARAE